ncbi:FtsK/SpoIIIE family DNA translocase [Crocinitomix catalasitica]|uniref:FtsK/SpoIIIE family DNA translocase n=1 Tax=Crocinitomix catalasitica TaxID=184607 RepID=UPI000561D122|nr:DNA translocase FtsK [Crocinitomix catalasitica]
MAKVSNKYNADLKGEEEKSKPKFKTKTKASKKAKKTAPTASDKKSINLLRPLSVLFDVKNEKSNRIVGALLLLISMYLILAFISYMFTWQFDQNFVINKGFFEFIFNTNEIDLGNHLGKFGAWISHRFIYNWFGLSSFLFPFIFTLLGIFLLFRAEILPLKKTISKTVIGIVIFSLCLGFFDTGLGFPYGGAFGYQFNAWLKVAVGSFGALLFLLVLLYISVVFLFNPNFKALWAKLKFFESDEDEEKVIVKEQVDIVAVNTIKDEQIKTDAVSATIEFDENEEGDDVKEAVKPESEEADNGLSLEIETPIEEEPIGIEIKTENKSDEEDKTELVVETLAEEVLSDKDINSKLKEFGEYDPKLDLSSYKLPELDLLNKYGSGQLNIDKAELENNKNRIVEALGHYKIEISKIKATVGPTVTLYEIVPAPGVRISKIKNLADDIALSLAANGIRIIAPIPGRGTIGIEVPNSKPEIVSMRAMISAEKFQNSDMELPIVIGKTIANETFVFDLAKAPHLLCAGATGQGKSVGLNAILVSILYKKHPAQVKFVMVDPKKVELTLYNKIERHFLAKLPDSDDPIITDTSKVVNTMNSLCIEMDNRYELLKDAQVRNIIEYNKKFISRRLNPELGHRFLPYIVVVIDEFADLIMTAGKEIEHPIARLAQLARAIGIHLIVATQRPSVNVITGMIKANFPVRIAFKVSSGVDSKTILDSTGAEQLIGRGDMLISFGSDLTRLQCAFVDTDEVEKICEYIGNQRAYPEALLLPEYVGENEEGGLDVDLEDRDDLFEDAARILVTHQQGSASLLQRKMKIGYNRAGRIIDQMEVAGIIGPFKGSKAREVLVSDLGSLELFLADIK